MPFITFIYRIGNDKQTYYGKYVTDYISDDHNGLDKEVKYALKNGIKKHRIQQGLTELTEKLYVGVLSLSASDYIVPSFSTKKEIKCFDFYYIDYEGETPELYINGKIVKDNEQSI